MDASKLANEAPHFFTQIAMHLIPDSEYEKLLKLSHFAKLNKSVSKFDLLQDSLRKYQWAILAFIKAKHINAVLVNEEVDNYILMDLNGSTEFSRAVFELIIYGKASLDSLAQFIGEYFEFGIKPRDCDFKWKIFREKFEHLGIFDGFVAEFDSWLDKDSAFTDSISATRDTWIHRGFIVLPFLWPPNELGCFGISKNIDLGNLMDTKFSREFFVPVNEFLELHQSRLMRLLFGVLESVAEIESQGRSFKLPERGARNKMSFLPTGITIEQSWVGFKIGPFSRN
jgi:hypothetical protein